MSKQLDFIARTASDERLSEEERWSIIAYHPSVQELLAAVAWVAVRVEDTCDGLLIHPDDAKKWGLMEDHPYEGTFLPDGRYRIALTRPAEQAVTDEMIERLVQTTRKYTIETLFIEEHRDLIRAALTTALSRTEQKEVENG